MNNIYNPQKKFQDEFLPYLFNLRTNKITLTNFRNYVLKYNHYINSKTFPIIFGIIKTLNNVGLSIFNISKLPFIIKIMKLITNELN